MLQTNPTPTINNLITSYNKYKNTKIKRKQIEFNKEKEIWEMGKNDIKKIKIEIKINIKMKIKNKKQKIEPKNKNKNER